MSAIPQMPFRVFSGTNSLRLDTLVRLRWLALIGQATTIVVVHFQFGYWVPLLPAFVLIAVSAVLNVGLLMRLGAGYRPSPIFSAAQLAFDCLQLGGLLWLTGGLVNPFSILLLAPVAVSASILPQRETVAIAGLVVLIAAGLTMSHLPLPWVENAPLGLPPVYVLALFAALALSVVFIGTYVNRVANESRQLSDALTATELAISRQQQLSALDGLAAAAAHELGTPLATITVAAREMRREMEDGELAEDVDLIIEQANRCRSILSRLRGLDLEDGQSPFVSQPASELIRELARPHQDGPIAIDIETEGDSEIEPHMPRNVGIVYALSNFVDNAVQFARSRVIISARWTSSELTIVICDDGPGFSADLLTRLGEPYLTTRAANTLDNEGPGGLGLGVFIGKTLLNRSGAAVSFANARSDGHAEARVTWARDELVHTKG